MPQVVWETEEEAAVPLSEGAGAAWDNDHASVRSLSTYPLLPTGQRDGDPNADCAWVRLYPTRAILALADGCNWGYRPREAARSAVAALKDYLSRRVIGYLPDLHEAAHYLLRGFAEADRKIMEGKDDTWEAGTTTLIGGVLLQLVPASSSSSSTSSPSTSPPAGGEDMGGGEWGFVCCSVGDCKAFRYAAANGGEVTDITAGNRLNVTDVRDPGGRLGPYLEGGAPDLRNLKLYYISCEPGDLLLFLSDGVHDNFDPQMLGKVPREAGLDHVSDESWDVADNEVMLEIEIAKDQYRRQVLKQLIEAGPINPKAVTERLMAHCYSTTRACREYMETNPQARQPTDYRQFPGKMDHTTAACLVIPSRGSFARS